MCPESGFSIGPMDDSVTPSNNDEADADDLYKKLEYEIIPMYYEHHSEWLERMKYAITLGAYFNTHRCIEEYQQKAWQLPELHFQTNAGSKDSFVAELP